ncbi:MAG: hypothetical protein ACE5NP_07245 [Anaerolineae bacterium]
MPGPKDPKPGYNLKTEARGGRKQTHDIPAVPAVVMFLGATTTQRLLDQLMEGGDEHHQNEKRLDMK